MDLDNAYQVAREANIKRNLEELEALGLNVKENVPETAKTVKKQKRKIESVPKRKSRRLQGEQPDGTPIVEHVKQERSNQVRTTMEMKISRLVQLHHSSGTSYENPTATYEHTWHRVKTMTDKRLATRIKVIEKACGQYCIVKMRMFTEVLILAGKTELAKQAAEALARLEKHIK